MPQPFGGQLHMDEFHSAHIHIEKNIFHFSDAPESTQNPQELKMPLTSIFKLLSSKEEYKRKHLNLLWGHSIKIYIMYPVQMMIDKIAAQSY